MSPLFKYVNNYVVAENFLKGNCKFTRPSDLNDPSELMPTFTLSEVTATRDQLRRTGYQHSDLVHLKRQEHLIRTLSPYHLGIAAPSTVDQANYIIRSSIYDNNDRLERELVSIASTISSNVGLLCLTRRLDSLPMWAHYADNAKGFVVEFSDLFSVFTGDDTGILRTPIDIEYTNDRIGVTFDPRSHKSMFFTKFEDWNYEVEVRVILPLKDCHKEIHNGSEMHIFTIPKRCIKRLILGWKMPQSDVDAIQKYISVHNPQVELAHAKFVRSKIQIAPGS